MPARFTKEPIPYVSNKTYLLRFCTGLACGLFAGSLAGNPILGVGAGMGLGTIFALHPQNKNKTQIVIISLCFGTGAGIGRLLGYPIPGAIVGAMLGFLLNYIWKKRTLSKLQNTNP